jgi:4-diphosphocytidyl-2-C-methyl-D-erythritol kinase
MHVRRSEKDLKVAAPAKLNLFLEVLGKRSDGYHEIETLMVPVAIFDSLTLQPRTDGQLRLTCRMAAEGATNESGDSSNSDAIPLDGRNLIVRSLELLRRHAGSEIFGADIHLEKRIPMAAGMAGGSSDAAATLLLANEAWGLGWSRTKLAEISAELGSDIPFFFGSGAAVCRGRGEQIEPVSGVGRLHFVIVKPPAGLSTAEVYRHCRAAEPPCRAEPLVDALCRGRLAQAGKHLLNRLQPPAETLSPWIARLRDEFARVDCLGHQMSGSGTSYFGLMRSARHARRIAATLRARNLGQVFATASYTASQTG